MQCRACLREVDHPPIDFRAQRERAVDVQIGQFEIEVADARRGADKGQDGIRMVEVGKRARAQRLTRIG